MITEKLKYSEKNLPYLVHHKSHRDWHGIESEPGHVLTLDFEMGCETA
jgi:hypothetical protein